MELRPQLGSILALVIYSGNGVDLDHISSEHPTPGIDLCVPLHESYLPTRAPTPAIPGVREAGAYADGVRAIYSASI